jgi:hypothetical protein
MTNEQINELLQENGLIETQTVGGSRIALALVESGNGVDDTLLLLANGLELALCRYSRSRVLLAKLCAHLQRLTGIEPSRLAVALAAATPDLVKSLSWITKLCKAGAVLLDWPQVGDIQNIGILATLNRVPKKLKEQVFESGQLPDGRDFRELDAKELSGAIDQLRRGDKPDPVPTNPYLEARRDLVWLVQQFTVTAPPTPSPNA